LPLTPQDMLRRMVAQLPAQTGKTYEQWVEVARAAGVDKHRALTSWLKQEKGLNHNQAQWIAWGVTDPGRLESYEKPRDLVDDLYSGKKAHLRPVHDALYAAAMGAEAGTAANVCKTYTSIARGVQFAIIAPRTNSLIDLELPLAPDGERRQAYKTSNPRFLSRYRIGSVDEIDDEVRAALRQAWQAVG
jgi:hypothetical protein